MYRRYFRVVPSATAQSYEVCNTPRIALQDKPGGLAERKGPVKSVRD
jgi:hypothetical protein